MQKDIIAIVPHYFNSLKYFDKLYDNLFEENIEIFYIFKKDTEMKYYCKNNHRKYEIIDFKRPKKIAFLFEPLIRYKFRKKVEKIILQYKFKLFLQVNDSNIYNDIIVKVAKRLKIATLVLQWAITSPEELYLKNREIKKHIILKTKKKYEIIIWKFVEKLLKILYHPILIFFGVYSNYKLSFGQGDSNIIGVINEYSKNLLIKQGINEKKIRIVGSFHYDDAIKIKNKNIDDLKKKYNIKDSIISIIYFSQPFYRKDLMVLTLEEQLNYIEDLITYIGNFFYNKGKDYILLIKLHPAEDLSDYKRFFNRKNLKLITDADNNELILLSDICISQNSTVLQNVIILKKSVIALNILKLKEIEIGSQVLGIKKCVNTWEEFIQTLDIFNKNKDILLNNINYDRVIMDGKCYSRIITLIKNLINKTKLRVDLKR